MTLNKFLVEIPEYLKYSFEFIETWLSVACTHLEIK